jgi:RNA polymerase sigma factor (sigma-70 family)
MGKATLNIIERRNRFGVPERTGRPARPSPAEVHPAALELIERHGPQIMSTARRYSETAEDAEDAYQRGLEILLTKAPTTDESELLPWLRTVVRHEAFAIRRQRQRAALGVDDDLVDRGGVAPSTDEQAERHERLRLGAEALGRLKPQEIRCLVLKAEGYSYKQICEETGWTYTKVNRCLTEGRRSFLRRVAGIETGEECERMAPLLSALADGEATSRDMDLLRPHLRGCLACKATLRSYRQAPARVAALAAGLAGAGALGGDGGAEAAGGAGEAAGGAGEAEGTFLDSLGDWLGDRLASLPTKVQHTIEIAGAHKLAAVAASTAVVAGGGAATVTTIEGGHPAKPVPSQAAPLAPPAAEPGERRGGDSDDRRRERRREGRAAEEPRLSGPAGGSVGSGGEAAEAPSHGAGEGGAPAAGGSEFAPGPSPGGSSAAAPASRPAPSRAPPPSSPPGGGGGAGEFSP